MHSSTDEKMLAPEAHRGLTMAGSVFSVWGNFMEHKSHY